MDQMFFGQDNKLDNILKAVWKISGFKQRLSMMSFALKKKDLFGSNVQDLQEASRPVLCLCHDPGENDQRLS